jgi:transaldolase/glucose-6-phosphate isomerase
MQPVGVLDTAKATNPLKELLNFGQSVWLDYIRRDLLTSGELKRLIDEDGLRGMTSNPTIFEKAIAGGTLYDDLLNSLRSRTDLDAKGRFEVLAIRDIQDAADMFRPVYESTKRRDGYVSIEVSPYLARDMKGSLEEARRLWKSVGRENVMVKIPGTAEGLPAIQQAISEGININITLLFAQDVYVKVAEAPDVHRWIAENRPGLEKHLMFTFSSALEPEIRDFLHHNNIPYLVKPFEVGDLISQARRLLQKTQSAVAG